MVASGVSQHALVVGADVMSSIIDYTDRSTCVLFGDGAGAAVLQPCEPDEGLLSVSIHSDGVLSTWPIPFRMQRRAS